MKAISLWQPWASLMAMGLKKNETRSWSTEYRGILIIHAAKKVIGWPDIHLEDAFDEDKFYMPSDLPLGCLLCTVDLYDVEKITYFNRPDVPELWYGDYATGRYMWKTRDVKPFVAPLPYRGRQRIFNVEDMLDSVATEKEIPQTKLPGF